MISYTEMELKMFFDLHNQCKHVNIIEVLWDISWSTEWEVDFHFPYVLKKQQQKKKLYFHKSDYICSEGHHVLFVI